MAEYIIDKQQLIEAIRWDCEVILGFYLGEKLDLEIPEFHKEIWDEFLQLLDEANQPDMLVGVLQKLLGVPREHAKTTLVKLAEQKGCALDDLPLAQMQSVHKNITKDLFKAIALDACVARRTSLGGTAPGQVRAALAAARKDYL